MHKVVSCATAGSVGDLGRIARRLADEGIDIRFIGGGEGALPSGSAGIVSMIVSPDEDEQKIIDILTDLELGGGRRLASVRLFSALDLDLDDEPGELAAAAATLGEADMNIMSVISIESRARRAIVNLAFEDESARDRARDVLKADGFAVMDTHIRGHSD